MLNSKEIRNVKFSKAMGGYKQEEVDILPEAEKTCRFIMEKDGAMSILVFFENSGNVYKILYNTTSVDSGVYDCEIFCKAITFKAFQYYDDITAADKD